MKQVKKRRLYIKGKKFVISVLEHVFAIVLSVVFCLNAEMALANLGFENYQTKLADDARVKNEYVDSLNWYEKIAKKDNHLSPYAQLAMAEIYANELPNKNYILALGNYREAIVDCKDIRILKSAMNFIINQISLLRENGYSSAINVLSVENVDFVIDVVNKIYEFDPYSFFFFSKFIPATRDNIELFFDTQYNTSVDKTSWEYVSTLTSDKSNLAFANDEEQLILVDSWLEDISIDSASKVTVYKYFRYKTRKESLSVNMFGEIKAMLPYCEPIYLCEVTESTV